MRGKLNLTDEGSGTAKARSPKRGPVTCGCDSRRSEWGFKTLKGAQQRIKNGDECLRLVLQLR